MLPGGRVEQLEESENTIVREIKEEIGCKNMDYTYDPELQMFWSDKSYYQRHKEYQQESALS